MTEEEAKQRWCPQTRVSLYHRSTDANRMARYGSGVDSEDMQAFQAATRCLGSGCMAWRWDLSNLGHTTGRCGLAGKP